MAVTSINHLKKIDRGIYRDRRDDSWEIFVRVGKLPLAHRHLDAALDLRAVRDKRDELRRDLRQRAKTVGVKKGTFAADVSVFVKLLEGRPRLQKERTAQLALWSKVFGHRPRAAIASLEIQQVLAGWAKEGFAYDTLHHRRAALLGLYKALDKGLGLPNPVADTTVPLKKPDPEPRGLPLPIVFQILAAVSDQGGVVGKGKNGRHVASRARARIHVMAHTGMRHEELKRYRPRDLRLANRPAPIQDLSPYELVVHAAKGSDNRVIALTPEAERWLRELERVDAIGDFDKGSVYRAFRRALCKVGYAPPLPKGTWKRNQPKVRRRALPGTRSSVNGRPKGRTGLIRPYDLRHSFLTAAYEQTGDLAIVQELAGHKDIRMTKRYAKNAVPAVQRAAVAKLAAAMAAAHATAHVGVSPVAVVRAAAR